MRTVGLCAGIGGIELGLPTAEVVAVADTDKRAQQVLAHHHPNATVLGDWRALDSLDAFAPDLITAGLPCQPISLAGKKLADQDARYLFGDFVALLGRGELRPTVLLENVASFQSRRLLPQRRALLEGLKMLGYRTAEVRTMAADIGAPHLRERWFLLATFSDRAAPDFGRTHKAGGAGLGEMLPTPTAGHDSYNFGKFGLAGRLLPTPLADQRLGGPTRNQSLLSAIVGEPEITPTKELPDGAKIRRRFPPVANANGLITDWGDYAPAIERWAQILGRRPPSRAQTEGRAHLNPPLVEWLMGFPQGYLAAAGIENSAALRLLGNACVPQQAHAAAVQLSDAHSAQLAFA